MYKRQAVDTHNHAFVHRVTGLHKHAATVIQLTQGVGEDFTVVHGNQHTVFTASDVAFVWLIAVKDVGDQT